MTPYSGTSASHVVALSPSRYHSVRSRTSMLYLILAYTSLRANDCLEEGIHHHALATEIPALSILPLPLSRNSRSCWRRRRGSTPAIDRDPDPPSRVCTGDRDTTRRPTWRRMWTRVDRTWPRCSDRSSCIPLFLTTPFNPNAFLRLSPLSPSMVG